MARKVNVGGTWRTVQREYVNVNGTWRLVQREYVNVNGTWRFSWARTPGAPQNVSLTVNGSSAESLNVSSSPVTCVASWSQLSNDTGLPIEVKFFKGASQVGSTQNVVSGTSATQSITMTPGESANILAYVRTRNGRANAVDATYDVYSNQAGSNAVTTTYPEPSLGTVNVTKASGSSDVGINWTANNLPGSGVSYTVYWSDSLYNTTSTALGSTNINATNRTATIPASVHNNQLIDSNMYNESVTFDVAVTLYVNGVQVGNPAYGTAAFWISPGA